MQFFLLTLCFGFAFYLFDVVSTVGVVFFLFFLANSAGTMYVDTATLTCL